MVALKLAPPAHDMAAMAPGRRPGRLPASGSSQRRAFDGVRLAVMSRHQGSRRLSAGLVCADAGTATMVQDPQLRRKPRHGCCRANLARMSIQRWCTAAPGRSHTVAPRRPALDGVERTQPASRSGRTGRRDLDASGQRALGCVTPLQRLLAVQLLLAEIADRPAFDQRGCTWIGVEPEHRPQHLVFGAALAPGLLIEIIATDARVRPQGPCVSGRSITM